MTENGSHSDEPKIQNRRTEDASIEYAVEPDLAIMIPVDPHDPSRIEIIPSRRADRATAFRDWVDGHPTAVPLHDPDATLFFSEASDDRELTVNSRATTLAWLHSAEFRDREVVTGPAFLIGPATAGSEVNGVAPEWVNVMTNSGLLQVQEAFDPVLTRWRGRVFGRDWVSAHAKAAALRREVGLVRVVPTAAVDIVSLWILLGETVLRSREDCPAGPVSVNLLSCASIQDLELQILLSDLRAGDAFSWRDLCLLNLADDGEEWVALRSGYGRSIPPLRQLIAEEEFGPLVDRLLAATGKQLRGNSF